jgi:hypothetical protein
MASRVSGTLQNSSPRIANIQVGIWTQHRLSTNQQCNRVDSDAYINHMTSEPSIQEFWFSRIWYFLFSLSLVNFRYFQEDNPLNSLSVTELIIASPCSGDQVKVKKVAQLVKKFTGVVESERLLSCSKSPSFVPNLVQIHPVHTNSISARSVSILYSHLNVRIPINSFQIFQVKFFKHFLYLTHTL